MNVVFFGTILSHGEQAFYVRKEAGREGSAIKIAMKLCVKMQFRNFGANLWLLRMLLLFYFFLLFSSFYFKEGTRMPIGVWIFQLGLLLVLLSLLLVLLLPFVIMRPIWFSFDKNRIRQLYFYHRDDNWRLAFFLYFRYVYFLFIPLLFLGLASALWIWISQKS